MKIPLRLAFIFLVFISTACASLQGQALPPTLVLVTVDPNASPSPTPFQPVTLAPTAIESPTLISTFTPEPPTNTPPPTLAFTATTLPLPTAPPQSSRTQYTLFALLDYYGHQLAVDETIRYTNQTGVSLNELVMAVEPAHRGGFALENILQDGITLNYDLTGHRLTVYLPQPLAPNAQVNLSMRFRITIPSKLKEHPYGYDSTQTNLTDWYPFIVPYNNGWILHDEYYLGEHLMYDAADFEVNVRTTEAGPTFAASGVAEPNNEWTRYRLFGARTFALSASDEFLMSESAVGTVVIRSYYFSGFEAAGEGMLQAAVKAVALFDVKFAAYPYQSLSVVQTDIHDGQEYDGLVFLATDFYDEFGGTARSNLVSIGVHEIAHQWWYGLVGNDQAIEPWLDEAMAVYSERLFYEWNYPNYGDWWWQFRVDYFGPSGYVDTPIYSGGTFRAYTNAVYLNGAYFIEGLRVRMGDDNFYRFLKDYAARYSRGRATSFDFFAVVRQNTSADISDLINTYFQSDY